MNWLLFLLWAVEFLVGKPATVAQWQERWSRRHDLPYVTEIAFLPTKKTADLMGEQWQEKVKYLREGRPLWQNTPDAARFERAIKVGYKQIRLLNHVRALRCGFVVDGFGIWETGDSWEKRLALADLYRTLE